MAPTARTIHDSIDYINTEFSQVIKQLAHTSVFSKGVPENNGITKKRYDRLDKFLDWLERDVRMTPELKDSSSIGNALQFMYAREGFYFPAPCVERARVLYKKWESEGWRSGGRGEDVEMEDAPADQDDIVTNRRSSSSAKTEKIRKDSASASTGGAKAGTIKLPPKDHTIWGTEGIMHGVALSYGANNRPAFVLDPRYQKRNPKVHGHNGIDVGTWYPRQLVALFHGAHGHQQAGISGDQHTGAFSVVVAGQYDALDQDRGEWLYYSGSGSHANTDPKEPAPSAAGTLALHTSLATGKPVRVLRGHTGKSKYAPHVGMRYDGLYTVVSVNQPKNAKGGLYEQFKLERLPGQGEINSFRPNAREVRYEEQIKGVNTSRWETL